MHDERLVIARRHLELVQNGMSRRDALAQLQKEHLLDGNLTEERRAEILREFSDTLIQYLDPQVRRTIR